MIQTDVLVIGAGPSGTVAAAIIKKAGFDVHIVEKMQFPRFVIGESLLPRCLEALEDAGFMDALNEKKFQVNYIRGRQTIFIQPMNEPLKKYSVVIYNLMGQRLFEKNCIGSTNIRLNGNVSTVFELWIFTQKERFAKKYCSPN